MQLNQERRQWLIEQRIPARIWRSYFSTSRTYSNLWWMSWLGRLPPIREILFRISPFVSVRPGGDIRHRGYG